MNELTIDQMCNIVNNAPEWAKGYNTVISQYVRSCWFSRDIPLSDLKAQVDQHYYDQSEEEELKQYDVLIQEKIEGGAILVGGLSIQKMVDYQDVVAKQQSEIDQLKAQFNNMEQCYIEKKKQVEDQQMRINPDDKNFLSKCVEYQDVISSQQSKIEQLEKEKFLLSEKVRKVRWLLSNNSFDQTIKNCLKILR